MGEGIGLRPVGAYAGKKRRPSMAEAVGCTYQWAKFYMENDPDIWDAFLSPGHYQVWRDNFLFSGGVEHLPNRQKWWRRK